jgi:putative addiction module antidote
MEGGIFRNSIAFVMRGGIGALNFLVSLGVRLKLFSVGAEVDMSALEKIELETLAAQGHGGSLGVILPPEVVAGLNLAEGDRLYLTKLPDGYRLGKTNPDFERQMALAQKIMEERRELLRELAK